MSVGVANVSGQPGVETVVVHPTVWDPPEPRSLQPPRYGPRALPVATADVRPRGRGPPARREHRPPRRGWSVDHSPVRGRAL